MKAIKPDKSLFAKVIVLLPGHQSKNNYWQKLITPDMLRTLRHPPPYPRSCSATDIVSKKYPACLLYLSEGGESLRRKVGQGKEYDVN